ncbi:iron chelate uptake ABC transporter family permease subunit [Corynebacterium sp. zg254]|uniref:Iron ABC transporter permease n=1 Tax=Corynebacterium zhongnanshanii TaxID=2768834 RepID=A0ABQ6VEJ3_9CORY|nr:MULTISPECIES: iron ABC transporter permease [Corynebacterium]KAB3522847.1 iron ABC transporter permease [Corynebacterium zhongnanshanii]MCR5914082.1 iron chelate uptake ABC transporter family permease subunit [Corynebacterium sp. zg254]
MATSNPTTQFRRGSLRHLSGLGVLFLLLLASVLASIFFGARSVPFGEISNVLRDPSILFGHPDALNVDQRVLVELRVPRTLLGLVAGAALGVCGALIQGHTRNPLADTGILGINFGASLAVVVSFSLFSVTSVWAISLWAFVGAVIATGAVFSLSLVGGGQANPLTLVLGGAALSAVLSAIISGFILTKDANLNHMRFWTVGSIAGRDLTVFYGVLPFIVVGIVLALATAPQLNLLNLGDDIASGLGVNTQRARVMGMAIIALLAGAATAAAGPITFIGLVVPHMVRAITGPDYRWILPYSALGGAVLMLIADVVGRLIARPGELQVGIVLAFVGAPFFIFLIYRRRVVAI